MTPSTTHDHIAAWTAANCKAHGAMITSAPTTSATHSSHSANCMSAARPMTKMITPPTHAVLAAVRSPENPRAQGEYKEQHTADQVDPVLDIFFAPAQRSHVRQYKPPSLHATLNNVSNSFT